ncbi:MAG TPA: hypothetical protein PLG59_03345, partial [bacterium]|nr:hypothetical protein [bacterium]
GWGEGNRLPLSTFLLFILPLFLLGLFCSPSHSQPLQFYERLEVQRIEGRVAGFDVFTPDRQLVAAIRFSANAVFWPETIEQTDLNSRLTLRFSKFQCREDSGLELSEDSAISVVWNRDDEFPEVYFLMGIKQFDPASWEKTQGRIPFHFLICMLREAEVFHQRGWLIATPLSDPFSLQSTPDGIRSAWSSDWSYAPALGCHPIPVIGLWAAHHGRYVAYDFCETRLSDNSEKAVGTAFCRQHGYYRQFITLVYPTSSRRVDELVYPKADDRILSHFRLVWSMDLPPEKDPNRFLIGRLANLAPNALPTVPRVNDLDYMPGPTRLNSFTEVAPKPLIGPSPEIQYVEEGTVLIDGWKTHVGSMVDRAFTQHDAQGITILQEQAQRLLSVGKRFRVDQDHCFYWEKPIQGKWQEAYGGEAVRTLHNSDGFAAARMLLNLWKHDPKPEYLEAAEGALNWARHIVWTRNEFVDVPSAPFAIGGSLPIAFLLDYHHLFRDDKERGERAREALDLAVTFAYRYLPVWLYDNNREDALDSTFLLERNAGHEWAGSACGNEVTWQIEAMADVAVTSGDPVLKHILHGILERWPLLYREESASSVTQYDAAFTEQLGLYPGCAVGIGNRAIFGWAEPFHLLYPVGDTEVRVVCGEADCFVTNRGGRHTVVEDYRTDGKSKFSFRLRSTLDVPFDVAITIPRVDLSNLPIGVKHGRKVTPLQEGTGILHAAERSDSLILWQVRNGDTIVIGGEIPKERRKKSRQRRVENKIEKADILQTGPFLTHHPRKTEPLMCDWLDTNSKAGLFTGLQYAYGIPFFVESDEWGNPQAWQSKVDIDRSLRGKHLFLFWIPDGPDAEITLNQGRGKKQRSGAQNSVPVRQGWPPMFHWKLLLAHLPGSMTDRIQDLEISGGKVIALTSAPGNLPGMDRILQNLENTIGQRGDVLRNHFGSTPQ